MDIMHFGSWVPQEAATEYIRKGELAVLKCRAECGTDDWRRVEVFQRFFCQVWFMREALSKLLQDVSDVDEEMVTAIFQFFRII